MSSAWEIKPIVLHFTYGGKNTRQK